MNTELDNIFILQAIIKGSKKAHQSLNSSVTIPMMMVRPEVCRSILHTLELEAAYLLCTLPWVAEMIRHLYDYHWQFYVAFDARIWCFSSIPTRNITCFWFGQTWNSPELSNLKILTRTLIPQLWFFLVWPFLSSFLKRSALSLCYIFFSTEPSGGRDFLLIILSQPISCSWPKKEKLLIWTVFFSCFSLCVDKAGAFITSLQYFLL